MDKRRRTGELAVQYILVQGYYSFNVGKLYFSTESNRYTKTFLLKPVCLILKT